MKTRNIVCLSLPLILFWLTLFNSAQAALVDVADYTARVTASALNVRSGPGTQYSVLGHRTQNQTVTVTHHDGAWKKIVWGGANAYMYGSYLVSIGSAAPPPVSNRDVNVVDYNGIITASVLNVRSGPGTNYSVIGTRNLNSTVRVTHHNGAWKKISWSGGANAYVYGSYVRTAPVAVTPTPAPTPVPAPVAPTPTPTPAPPSVPRDINVSDYSARITASALSVRSGPSVSSRRIDVVYRNTVVRVTHHNGIWRKIVWSGGRTGYAYGSYVARIASSTQPVSCNVPTMLTYSLEALQAARNFKSHFNRIISNPADGATVAVCGTGSFGGAVVGGGATACTGIDTGLQLGVVGTLGGGIGITNGGSGGGGIMASNARISRLDGWGICAGGNVTLGVGGDGELCSGLNLPDARSCVWRPNGVLQGYLGASVGGEASGTVTLTKTWTKSAGWRDVASAAKKLVSAGSGFVKRVAENVVKRVLDKYNPFRWPF